MKYLRIVLLLVLVVFAFSACAKKSKSNSDEPGNGGGGGSGSTGNNWTTPVILPKPPADDMPDAAEGQPCEYPDIEVGSAIYIGFSVRKTGINNTRYIFCYASENGVSWTIPHRLATNSYVQQPRIAKDTGGMAHILTSELTEDEEWKLYHVTTTDGVSYIEETVASSEYNALSLDIAVDSADDIHIVWRSDNDFGIGHSNPVYRKCTDGNWSSRKCLTLQDDWPMRFPRIAADSNNNPHVVMREQGTARIFYLTSLDGGVEWSWPPERAVNVTNSAEDIETVTDSNNKVHIVWSNGEEVLHVSGNQGSWSTPVKISGEHASTYCGLAIDSLDTLHVVFDGVYYTKSTDSGITWSTPLKISGDDGEMPSIAVDASGYLHTVWSSNGIVGYSKSQ